jgi:hypothetical protein
MESGNRRSRYWALYCAIFVVCVVGISLHQWLYVDAWRADTWVSTLSQVSSASLGLAFLIAILVEAVIAMVLFAPMLRRKWLEQGREEGREEIRKELRDKYAALEAWYQRKREAESNNQPFDEPPPAP